MAEHPEENSSRFGSIIGFPLQSMTFLQPRKRSEEEVNAFSFNSVEARANAYGFAAMKIRNFPLSAGWEVWYALGQAQNDTEGREFAIEQMKLSNNQYDLEYILSSEYIGLTITEIMKIQESSFEDQGTEWGTYDYADTPVGILTGAYNLGRDMSYASTERGLNDRFIVDYRNNVAVAFAITSAVVAVAPGGGAIPAATGLSATTQRVMQVARFLRASPPGVWIADSIAPAGLTAEGALKWGRRFAIGGPRLIGGIAALSIGISVGLVHSLDDEGLEDLKATEERALLTGLLELQGIFEQPVGQAAGEDELVEDSGETVFVGPDGVVMTFDEAIENAGMDEFVPAETTTTTAAPTTAAARISTGVPGTFDRSEAPVRPAFQDSTGAYKAAVPEGITQVQVSVPDRSSQDSDDPTFGDRNRSIDSEPSPNQSAGVQESDDSGPGISDADLDDVASLGEEEDETDHHHAHPYGDDPYLGVPQNYRRTTDDFDRPYIPPGGVIKFMGQDRPTGFPVYNESSVADEMASWSYLELLDFQKAAVSAGLISPEASVGGVPFFPGVLDGFTITALTGAMTQANRTGNDQTYWEAMEIMTESRDRAKAIYGDGRQPPTWVAPKYFAPDYATISQDVKTLFSQGLGREPNEWEMELLADSFRADSRAEFNEETLGPARRTYDRELREFEEEGDEDEFDWDAFEAVGRVSEPGDIDIPPPEDVVAAGIDINPQDRMLENFDKKFANELSAKDRWADVQSQTGNLFASLNRLSNP